MAWQCPSYDRTHHISFQKVIEHQLQSFVPKGSIPTLHSFVLQSLVLCMNKNCWEFVFAITFLLGAITIILVNHLQTLLDPFPQTVTKYIKPNQGKEYHFIILHTWLDRRCRIWGLWQLRVQKPLRLIPWPPLQNTDTIVLTSKLGCEHGDGTYHIKLMSSQQ
jgi:hypothetical protein